MVCRPGTKAPTPLSPIPIGTSSAGGASQSGSPLPTGNDHTRGLSRGTIAGVAVGSTSGSGIIIILVLWAFRRKRKQRRQFNLLDEGATEHTEEHVDPFISNGQFWSGLVTPFSIPDGKENENEKPLDSEQVTPDEADELGHAANINLSHSSQGGARGGARQNDTIRRTGQHTPPLDSRDHNPEGEIVFAHDSLQTSTENNAQDEDAPPPDLFQLFENRVFENQLIQLISERMDRGPPPPISNRSSEDGLPAYQSTHG